MAFKHASTPEKIVMPTAQKHAAALAGALALAVLPLALAVAGCNSSSKTAAAPVIPVAPAASPVTYYAGTQELGEDGAVSPGGVWELTLNSALKQFSADDISALPSINSGSAISGATAATGGFLSLTPEDNPSLSGGYALSVPGEAALLRSGYNGEAPVAMAGESDCLGAAASSKFLFVALPNLNWTVASPAYGSVEASSTGSDWSFSSGAQSQLGGAAAAALNIPAGTCNQAEEGYVVSVPASAATGGETYTIAIGPTGYFVMDMGAGNPSNYGPSSLVGVLAPSAALATADVAASKFLGFYYEPLAGNVGLPVTQLAAFGQGGHSGTSITGGVYAADDPTTQPNADTAIDFGAQDSGQNGLYPNATVVVPDPYAVCTGAAVTTTPSGVEGCILPAVAVVGDANNRFSVFLIAWDTTNATPLGIYLYAQ